MKEAFTQVPNRLIRSKLLDPYDKVVFMAIASCNPSFPSYTCLMEWCGMSRDRVWISLRNLEKHGVIERFKKGRSVFYRTHWTSPPGGPIKGQPVRYTDRTSPPGGLVSVRQADSKKNNEKEQTKKRIDFSNLPENGIVKGIMKSL